MKKTILINDIIKKDFYLETMKLINKEIDEYSFIKDNVYYMMVEAIYLEEFKKLSDMSNPYDYIKAGTRIYNKLHDLNTRFNNKYGGEFDSQLLWCIAGQFLHYFDNSVNLRHEDNKTLNDKMRIELNKTVSTPFNPRSTRDVDKSFHIQLNNLIINKKINNKYLIEQSSLHENVIKNLRSGKMRYSKDIIYILALAMHLTKYELNNFIENSNIKITMDEPRDHIILEAMCSLIQLRNIHENKSKKAVEIVNEILKQNHKKELKTKYIKYETVNNASNGTISLLITGGLGFIGKNCINYFKQKYGFEQIYITVSKIDNNSTIPNNVIAYSGKIDSDLLYERIFLENKIDYVIHLAAKPIVKDVNNDPINGYDINSQSVCKLLDSIYSNSIPVKGIIFTSTELVYGSEYNLCKEDQKAYPNDTYASSKVNAENIVCDYARKGLPVIITRLSNVYGEYDFYTDKRLIPRTIHLLNQNKSPALYVNQESHQSEKKDFLYIGDLMAAFDLIFKKFADNNFHYDKNKIIYNIGSGEFHSVQDIIEKIIYIMDLDVQPDIVEVPDMYRNSIMSIDKFKEDYGFSPKISLDEGLKRTVNWYLDNPMT